MTAQLRILLSLSLLIALGACSKTTPPDIALASLPDMDQFGREVSEKFNPRTLCAPVAASNGIAWLQGGMSEDAQWDLALKLASRPYMSTFRSVGTAPFALMRGLERYSSEAGWSGASVEYRGWRPVREEHRGPGPLSLAWLHESLAAGAVVLLNLGWYEATWPGIFKRTGGHWVTLQGVLGGALVLHDPGPWQGEVEPLSLHSHTRIAMRWDGNYRWFPQGLELVDAPSPAGERVFIDGAVSFLPGREGLDGRP